MTEIEQSCGHCQIILQQLYVDDERHSYVTFHAESDCPRCGADLRVMGQLQMSPRTATVTVSVTFNPSRRNGFVTPDWASGQEPVFVRRSG